jgi:hypothetical protein
MEKDGSLLHKRRVLRMPARFVITLAALCLCFDSASSQDPKKVSDEGIAPIRAYAGTWKIQIDTVDTVHSKAAHESQNLRNDCWSSGPYYACNQNVGGESKVLIVFTYDAVKKIYTSYQIPSDGSSASSGILEIKGNVWTFPWAQTEDGTTTHYRVVNVFDSPNRIRYRREFSTDQVTWTVMATGNEVKVK